MIVGEAERQDRSDGDLSIDRDRFGLPLADAQDRDLGRVDDRRKMAAADAALVRNRERAALQLLEGNLALAGLLGERVQLLRKLKKIFPSTSRNIGTIRPPSVSTATPMWQ